MPEFTLICKYDNIDVTTKTFEEVELHNVLNNIELFLRGCGYIFEGNLDIVDNSFMDEPPPWLDPQNRC
jgi:hypothetical protein